MFVLDGLDECSDARIFVQELRFLVKDIKAKVLITSRQEKYLLKEFGTCDSLTLTPDHVQKDIETFVEYKMARNPRLSNPLVVHLMGEKLLRSNNGMFLWVRLVLKELKACLSVEQIRQTLIELPRELESIYSAVVKRLRMTLTRAAFEVSRKVLAWTIGCARPISFHELCTALTHQYKLEGHTLLYQDSMFPYSEKDIEIMCGSLVVIRNGQAQLAHYTIKSYIFEWTKKNNSCTSVDTFYLPDSTQTSLDLAKVCLTYFIERSPLVSIPNHSMIRSNKSNEVFNDDTFLEYSCIYWVYHSLDCPIKHGNDLALLLHNYIISSEATRSWLQTSLLLDRRGLWRLAIGLEELEALFTEMKETGNVTKDVSQSYEWCAGVRSCLDEYGTTFMKSPSLIQTLKLESFSLGESRVSVAEPRVENQREVEVLLHKSGTPTARDSDFERTHLGYENQHVRYFNLWKAELGFFIYDPNQNIFFNGEMNPGEWSTTDHFEEWLFVQNAENGKRLSPVALDLGQTYPGRVVSTAISSDGRFLVIAYTRALSVWVIERNLMATESGKAAQRLASRNWAFRLILSPYPNSASFDDVCIGAPICVFSPSNCLFVPGGFFKLPSRKFYSFDSFKAMDSPHSPVLYSGNGSYLFWTKEEMSHMHIFQHSTNCMLNSPSLHMLEAKPSSTFKPSSTGAWLVLFDPDINAESTFISLIENNSSQSFDISAGKTHFGHRSFHFSEDDARLVTFLRGPKSECDIFATVTVTVWQLTAEGPKKRSEGAMQMAVKSCSAWGINPPLLAMKSDKFAWIVTCNRSIYAVQLDPSVSFPDHEFVDGYIKTDNHGGEFFEPQPRTVQRNINKYSQISQDCSRLATVCVRESEVQLQILSLSGNCPGEVILDKTCKLPGPTHLVWYDPVILSKDFDTIIVGTYAFIIDHHDTSIVKFDINLRKFRPKSIPKCSISSCGSIVAFWSLFKGENHEELGIFRIDRSIPASSRLDIAQTSETVLKNLNIRNCSVQIHPLSQIIAFTYILAEGYSEMSSDYPIKHLVTSKIHVPELQNLSGIQFQRFWNSKWAAELGEMDSAEMKMRRDPMMETISPGLMDPEGLVNTSAAFSDCGTFIYIQCQDSNGDRTGRIILNDISFSPQPLKILGKGITIHSTKFRSYILQIENGLVWVQMHEYETLPDDARLPLFQTVKRTVTTKYITAYPPRWGIWRMYAWLLLGDNYDERMKLLICPVRESVPVLKSLTVTWNDCLKELERKLVDNDCDE